MWRLSNRRVQSLGTMVPEACLTPGGKMEVRYGCFLIIRSGLNRIAPQFVYKCTGRVTFRDNALDFDLLSRNMAPTRSEKGLSSLSRLKSEMLTQ